MHLIRATKNRLRLLREEDGYSMLAVIGAIAGHDDAGQRSGRRHQRRPDPSSAGTSTRSGRTRRRRPGSPTTPTTSTPTAATGPAARDVPAPNAVNLNTNGNPTNTRPVPGSPTALATRIELLQASTSPGGSQCDSQNPNATMLEASGRTPGRSESGPPALGDEEGVDRRDVTSRRRSWTTVYFTQLETSDPVTYGFPNPSAALTGAYSPVHKFRRDGRESAPIPGTKQPVLRPDRLRRRRSRSTGRCTPTTTSGSAAARRSVATGADVTEVSAPPVGWAHGNSNCTASPTFRALPGDAGAGPDLRLRRTPP